MDSGVISATLAKTVAIQVATSGEGLAPQSVRGFGVEYDADAGVLSVLVCDAQATRLVAALRSSQFVALNLTDPVTFRGIQAKGPLVAIEEPSDEAARAAARYFEEFSNALASVGFKSAQVRGFFHHRSARWIRMRPAELFNQTPGPGAGAAL
jgi:hypothetical protein